MTDVIAGRFALLDPIARGGSGVVWRAYDRKLERFCAAKVLLRRDAGDLLRFVREQSVRLAHPNVLTPYSWAAEDAHVVIASELVDGGSLSVLLQDYGPLSEGTVTVLLDQLLIALDQVHRAGMVHRDVKPGNILLRATGNGPLEMLLGDFGLAMGAADTHLTQVGTVIGTPAYLPPELMRGGIAPDPRHDLFAAGKLAAALANGFEPQQVVGPADLAVLRPGPLRDTVAALASLDPAARPASAQAARRMLGTAPRDPLPRTRDGDVIEVLHHLPELSAEALAETQDGHTQPIEPPAPQRRRRRLLVAAGAVAAVAVAVPIALSLTGGEAPAPTTPSDATPQPGSPVVRFGAGCSWVQQGDVAKTAAGASATCVLLTSGTYVWRSSA